jgi:hypothetical protein
VSRRQAEAGHDWGNPQQPGADSCTGTQHLPAAHTARFGALKIDCLAHNRDPRVEVLAPY